MARAGVAAAIAELEAARQPVVAAENTAPALLGRGVLAGLRRLQEIVDTPITEEMMVHDPKRARLIGDMALGIVKLGLQAREGEASVRRDQALAALLEEIAAERNAKVIEGG
jgi:hypothetical protein